MGKRRVLIMYATMTKNTEKIAQVYKETFEAYNWDVTYLRLKGNIDWKEMQKDLYFDDYDVICLGSPIVGGSPLQIVQKLFSFGGGGELEKSVQKKLDENKTGSEAAEAAVPPKGPIWRKNRAPYAGVLNKSDSWPLGIVFSTYGGGFYGSMEAVPTLEMLGHYLRSYNVNVVGKFCCGGKETGPAGIPNGVKPPKDFVPGKDISSLEPADVVDATVYEMADGTKMPGSYFFHYDLESKPGERELAKAKYFIQDFIEDYFMTYDGNPAVAISEIISIS
ncbi:MAG: hypothetical protein K6G40_01080 [Eubacterium sp.]|nr:hypothetical protein [Eubacterium sp.]